MRRLGASTLRSACVALASLFFAAHAHADEPTTLRLPTAGLTLRVGTPYEWTVLAETRGLVKTDVVRRVEPATPRLSVTFERRRTTTCAQVFERVEASPTRPGFVPRAYRVTVIERAEGWEVVACLQLRSGALVARVESDTSAEESDWAATTPILADAARAATDEDERERPPPPPPPSPPATPPPPPPPRVEVSTWYGWQTLLVDAPAFAIMFASAKSDAPEAHKTWLPIGYVAYLFGPPLVHVAHDNAVRALVDLGVRFVAPLFYGMVTAFNSQAPQRDGMVAALAIGYAGAVLVDTAFIAHKITYVDAEPRAAATRTFIAMPQLELRTGGATVGVGGAF